jgi:2-polyprenyl-6-methoxyphenol hydroxylase-like FAD-dependent oxidoreductase
VTSAFAHRGGMNQTHAHVQRLGHRAVVIGASIGGLLTARVLSDFYDEVAVVERDAFGTYGDYRKGVQQARHAHGLLAGGLGAMEELLPGLTAEMEARGAIAGDLQQACNWVNEGHDLTRTPTGLRGLLTSRLLLEDQVRRRVLARTRIRVHERCDALGLTLAADGRVRGLRVSWRDREGAEELLTADLVVDASGRGSRAPAWLHALGYGTPRVDEIVIGLTYTTREFVRTTPDHEMDNQIVAATASHPRAGVMLAQPDARWVVTIGGYLGDAAPTDVDGFRDFAATLASPVIAQHLEGLTPIGEARTFKYHGSAWRRYDRMRRFPSGFLTLGDSICSFNPIFGQGMTVAAREALALRACLEQQGTRRLAARFFKAAKREIAVPWEIAAASDLRLKAVRGRRTPKTYVSNWYLRHYFRAAAHDDELGHAFLRVVNLLARPESLLAPARVWRVWQATRRAPVAHPATVPARREPARVA